MMHARRTLVAVVLAMGCGHSTEEQAEGIGRSFDELTLSACATSHSRAPGAVGALVAALA